jgi:hypothetical protein
MSNIRDLQKLRVTKNQSYPRRPKRRAVFAMKEMRKVKIVGKKSVTSVMNEYNFFLN